MSLVTKCALRYSLAINVTSTQQNIINVECENHRTNRPVANEHQMITWLECHCWKPLSLRTHLIFWIRLAGFAWVHIWPFWAYRPYSPQEQPTLNVAPFKLPHQDRHTRRHSLRLAETSVLIYDPREQNMDGVETSNGKKISQDSLLYKFEWNLLTTRWVLYLSIVCYLDDTSCKHIATTDNRKSREAGARS